MKRFDVRLGERYGYQSVAIWGDDLATALTEELARQKEPHKMGITAEDVLSVSLYRTKSEDEALAEEEDEETADLLGR